MNIWSSEYGKKFLIVGNVLLLIWAGIMVVGELSWGMFGPMLFLAMFLLFLSVAFGAATLRQVSYRLVCIPSVILNAAFFMLTFGINIFFIGTSLFLSGPGAYGVIIVLVLLNGLFVGNFVIALEKLRSLPPNKSLKDAP